MGVFLYALAANVVALAVLYARYGEEVKAMYGDGRLKFHYDTAYNRLDAFTGLGSPFACGMCQYATYTIQSDRVLLPDGIRPAFIVIVDGRIVSVTDGKPVWGQGKAPFFDYKNALVSPGVIDTHVHLNEPGRVSWEGVYTGTIAAAHGGITTVVDMPLNSDPVTTTPKQLRIKMEFGQEKAAVNVAYWGGITPSNAHKPDVLDAMIAGGALGFKSFMSPSGIDDFSNVSRSDLVAAVAFCKSRGVPYYLHAELVSEVPATEGAANSYATYLATRPPTFEREAIQMVVEVLDEDTSVAAPGFVLHIAHLADAESVATLADARTRHSLSVETCAHYLTFAAEDIPDGSTVHKCAPPLRDGANRAALRAAAAAGGLDTITSDHSPAPPSLKQLETGDFLKAWGGISGLQYLLPATWTALKDQPGFTLHRLSQLLSTGPAALIGMADRKGVIAPGFDADIVVWHPEALADTSAATNQHKHKLSPYTDLALLGKVQATIVNGRYSFLDGIAPRQSCGDVLRRDIGQVQQMEALQARAKTNFEASRKK